MNLRVQKFFGMMKKESQDPEERDQCPLYGQTAHPPCHYISQKTGSLLIPHANQELREWSVSEKHVRGSS